MSHDALQTTQSMPADRSDNSRRKRPPRKYLSRREQLRLLLLVGSLMLVVVLMNEARKPQHWRWLTGPDGEALTDAEFVGEDIDTRLQPAQNKDGVENLPGAIIAPSFRFEPPAGPDGGLEDEDAAYRRAEMEFWKQQMELLEWRDRRRLPQVLKAVRDGEPLPPEDAQAWAETLQLLDRRWQKYTEQAMDSLTFDPQLPDEDRGVWLSILSRLHNHWSERLHEALAAAAKPSTLTDAQRAELERFQALFDEMSIRAIRDDTVISRPAETNAWFRLFEQLQQAEPQALVEAEAPRIGFRQMFKQPEEYRGRLIRVRGEAKRAYHLQAPRNFVGIEGYYKFIVFPAGGPSSPIFVYTLEVPEGFPKITDLDVDKEVTDLEDVHVEFTGYFFKRVAYQATDSTRVAPLVLAKMPTWTPQQPKGDPKPPNPWLLLAAVLGTALLGTAVAAFVVSRHGATPSSKAYAPAARAKPQQFAALAEEDLAPPPEERLQQMSDGPHTDSESNS